MQVKFVECEKRNLNVNTYEIVADENDSFEELEKTISELHECEYLVVKTPVNHKDLLWGMSDLGCTFIETQIVLEVQKKRYRENLFLERFRKDIILKKADSEQEIQFIIEEIKKEIFDTDRIVLDCLFTKKDSAGRYVNWMLDHLKRGSYIMQLVYRQEPIGFFIVAPSESTRGYAGLAGMYQKFKNKGMGALVIQMMTEHIFEKGYTSVFTGVSSNNKSILNIHLMLGYEVKNMYYVYVKHQK